MPELQENLATLDKAVPAVPGKLAAVQRSAEALTQTATAMLAQFEQKKGDVLQLATQVRQALTDLQGEGTDQEGELRNAAEGVETALEGALAALHTEREHVSEAVNEAGNAFGSLEDHLQEGVTRAESAHEEATRAVTEVRTGLEQGEAEMETALIATEEAIAAAGQEIEDGQALVSEALTVLKERMTELLDEARGRLDQSENLLRNASASAETGVADAVTELERSKDQLYQALTTRVQNELRDRLDAVLENVVTNMGRLSSTVATTRGGIRDDREGVAGQFAEASGRLPALHAGVEAVRQAARDAGIAFG